jgi:hypothetical protein
MKYQKHPAGPCSGSSITSRVSARTQALWGVTAIVGCLSLPATAADVFDPGNLVVSISNYAGTASTVTVGQALPGGGTAVADGTYPNVFSNEGPDPSFGVTSPILLENMTTSGNLVSTFAVPTSAMVTSFSSKSELALNLSTDGTQLTFMGYAAPVNALDVSNSNTLGHVDATNPVASTYARAIGTIDAAGNLGVTPVNTYSGNNGRAAILATNVNGSGQSLLYTVGNAGNGSGTEPTNIVNNTGLQFTTPGGSADTTVVGVQQGTPGASSGFQYGYSVVQNGNPADKSGKDDNFRGVTIFNNTLYVTKGSGSNGIDTVYQVGTAGALPTADTASSTTFTILPGLPTQLAKSANGSSFYPFGLFFANSTTLYIADEGDGKIADATPAGSPNAGLEKWSLVNGTWQLDYTLQAGLNLGQQYSVNGLPSSLNPATAGLRNLAGRVDADGTVELYAITSTVSAQTDQGADPNRLVAIDDNLAFTTAVQAAGEQFTTLQTAAAGQVIRGVSFAPVPLPAGIWLLMSGIGALFGVGRRARSASA